MAKDLENQINDYASSLEKELNNTGVLYILRVGIVENNSPIREKKKTNKVNQKESEDEKPVTNAQLLYILSNGSSKRKMVPRPVLQYAIDDCQDIIHKACVEIAKLKLASLLDKKDRSKEMDEIAGRLGKRISDRAKLIAHRKDSRIAPNKPMTIKMKGSDVPLIDTGQMINSITYNVKKVKK